MKAREKAEKYAKEHPMSCEEDDECTQIIMNDYLAGYREAIRDAAEVAADEIIITHFDAVNDRTVDETHLCLCRSRILALGEEE